MWSLLHNRSGKAEDPTLWPWTSAVQSAALTPEGHNVNGLSVATPSSVGLVLAPPRLGGVSAHGGTANPASLTPSDTG